MKDNSDLYREACRRKHRVLGHYLAIQAWLRKLDCIVLLRGDIEHFLGLKKLNSVRIKWLMEDLKPWFPFQHPFYKAKAMSSINSLYIARHQIEGHLPEGSMPPDDRIAGLQEAGIKVEKFLIKKSSPPSESSIISELTLVTSGLNKPRIF